MNRILALLLTAALMLSVSACSEAAPAVAETTEAAETQPSPDDDFTGRRFLGIEAISYDDYVMICAKKSQSPTPLIDGLYYDGIEMLYDKENRTYFATVLPSEAWDDLTITNGGDASISFLGTDKLGTSKPDAIAAGKRYKLVTYTEDEYMLANIVFTYFGVMSVTLDNNSDNKSNPIGDRDERGEMRFITCEGEMSSDTFIHIRGGSSRSFPKVSYKLSLIDENDEQNKLKLLNMRSDDDWILLAMYTDESKIRDKLSYDLWGEFAAESNAYGIHNGAQLDYIELILNGRYWGIYGLVVPCDKSQQKLDTENGEALFKIESWEVPSSEKLYGAGESPVVDSIEMKQPEPPTQQAWDCIAPLVGLIFESGNDEFADKIADTVDISNVLDYWIMVNLMSGQDNGWKNMFITYKNNSDGGQTALVCPWDCDLTWGVTWKEDAPLFWVKKTEELVFMVGAGELPNRIIGLDVGGARDMLKEKWAALRESTLDEDKLCERVDALTARVFDSGAFGRDLERWPEGGHVSDDNSYIKVFIKRRLAFLDDYIDELN